VKSKTDKPEIKQAGTPFVRREFPLVEDYLSVFIFKSTKVAEQNLILSERKVLLLLFFLEKKG